MLECEIIRSGILFYAIEKGKSDSLDGKFYDNIEEAYVGTCEFLRKLGTSFIISVPAELYD